MLHVFDRRKAELSMAMRVLVVCIFLYTLFGFQNRQLLLPLQTVRAVQKQVHRFISRIIFTKLGLFCHVHILYGTQVQVRDLRRVPVLDMVRPCPL